MSVRMLEFLQVIIVYVLFVFGTGMLLDRRLVREKCFAFRLITDLVIGNFYIINMTFLFAYLKMLKPVLMFFGYYSIALLICYVSNRKELRDFWKKKRKKYELFLTGEYGTRVAIRQVFRNIFSRCRAFVTRYVRAASVIEVVCVIGILLIFTYYYSYHALNIVSYAAPDEEVHLYWVQSLISGELFPAGVYPFGMHCVEAAMCLIFQLNAVTVARNLGPIVGVIVMLMMYFLLKQISRVKFAPAFGMFLFAIADVVVYSTYNRFYATIPQEYAMMFMAPVIYYVFRYLKEKNKLDLILLGISFSITFAVHFYVSIICVYFFIGVGIVYLVRIIKQKMLLPLLVCGMISLVVAAAPLGIGLLCGWELEQSFKYGAAVMENDMNSYSTEDETLRTDKETEEIESEFEEQVWIIVGDYGNLVPTPFYKYPQYIKLFSKQYFETYVFEDIRYLLIFVIAAVLVFINWLLRFKKKNVDEQSMQWLSLTIFMCIMLFTMWITIFGLSSLLELKRMGIFVAYMLPVFMVIPIELVNSILGDNKKRTMALNIAMAVLAVGNVYYLKEHKMIKDLAPVYYYQTTGAMKSMIGIEKTYKPYTWTVVSVVNENSIVLNHGNHYEWIDLLEPLEKYKKNEEIYIPTQYVFFLIEKRPVVDYGVAFELGADQLENRPKITVEDALLPLEEEYASKDTYYKQNRSQIMARAYYYMQALRSYFPDECNVYYEDDEIIVYRLEQNTYALDNLAIDYRKELQKQHERKEQ